MNEILKDPMFFYAIAFVLFLGLAFRYGRSGFLGWIDGEIAKVRHQLDEAEKLRLEAEATLADYKAKQAAAMADADDLIRNAKDEAARLKAQAEADLKASLARHEQQALDRIRQAEANALADVRQRGIDLAMKVAQQTLEARLQGEAGAKLVDKAIADLPATTKAKAA
jgi:F-type H+-transporting ATPase subunit b